MNALMANVLLALFLASLTNLAVAALLAVLRGLATFIQMRRLEGPKYGFWMLAAVAVGFNGAICWALFMAARALYEGPKTGAVIASSFLVTCVLVFVFFPRPSHKREEQL